MRRIQFVAIVVLVVGIAAAAAAQRGSDLAVMLEAARQKAAIDGDLRGAIADYRTIVERHAGDHDVVATAWLQIADLYRTLGNDVEATDALERVVELTDQPHAVAAARARLGRDGVEQRPSTTSPRTVLVDSRTRNVVFPAISHDGRFLAYTDYVNANANVILRDLATGLDRQVTTEATAPGNEVWYKSFSRDDRWLAYTFDARELRLISLSSEQPEPKLLFKNEQTVSMVRPFNWSADGKRIAVVAVRGSESARIGYVSVADGELYAVRTLHWEGSHLSISPDGAYLAYERRLDEPGTTGLFVVSADGTRETQVLSQTGRVIVVGWSGDGRHLLYTSEKDGSNELWAHPMRNGRPSGKAVRLRTDVSPDPIGITADGDVYFAVDPSTQGIYFAPVDLAAGQAGRFSPKPIRGERPAWSPDGSELAFANPGPTRQRKVISVLAPGTGRVRDVLVEDLQYVQRFEWAADGASLVAKGQNRQNRSGLFRTDLRNGETTTIALQPGRPRPETFAQPKWWRGNSLLAYFRLRTNSPGRGPGIREAGADAPRFIERDLATGAERQLFDFSKEPWATYALSPSPDRRFLAARSAGQGEFAPGLYQSDPTSFVVVHDLATGQSRRIWTAPFPNAFSGSVEWLPDNSAVIVTKLVEPGASLREAWIVPIDGGEPRKLHLGVQNLLSDGVRLSPDGRTLAILAGDRRDTEVQVFEKIVPGSRAR